MTNLSVKNIDTFVVKQNILIALNKCIDKLNGALLDIGCGKMPYKEIIISKKKVISYTGLDLENARSYSEQVQPDVTWDGEIIPIKDHSFDSAMATEVLEHCFEPGILLNETFRVLKPDGLFFFTVPFLWPLHEIPNDAYRYTPWSLEKHLKDAGFCDIEIHALGGWHTAMAQMMGLWVARAPIDKYARSLCTRLAIPLMKILLKKEKGKKITFAEGQMITGIYGTARKPKN